MSPAHVSPQAGYFNYPNYWGGYPVGSAQELIKLIMSPRGMLPSDQSVIAATTSAKVTVPHGALFPGITHVPGRVVVVEPPVVVEDVEAVDVVVVPAKVVVVTVVVVVVGANVVVVAGVYRVIVSVN